MTGHDPKHRRVTSRLDETTAEALEAELDRLAMSESEYIRQALRLALGLPAALVCAECRRSVPKRGSAGGVDGDSE